MHEAIAIIGMGAQFPGAPDLDSFRHLVRTGAPQFSAVPTQRWDHTLVHSPNPRHATKTAANQGAFITDVDQFAPEFFGITPKRAKVMDPQQRLVIEVSRQALEDAGYAVRPFAGGKVGVYVGASSVDHRTVVTNPITFQYEMAGRSGITANLSAEEVRTITSGTPAPHAYSMVGNMHNMIAANVSQAFDFHGPAFTIDTACSSALAALHEAVLHLRHGIVDGAVVSGVYLMFEPAMLVLFSRIGAISASDDCRPFQANADGFVLGEGVGTVILKRLCDAERDGDRVVAVVRGIAMTNDGRGGGPLTPTVVGEAAAIHSAWQDAGLDPASVGLLEAHATGTQAGDSIELSALASVFGAIRNGPVPITSIKATIGHGLSAAGIASLIKAALAVSEGFIPPQVLTGEVRSELRDFSAWLHIPQELSEWKPKGGESRRAGVNAFGFGGTNLHVVLEEPLPIAKTPAPKTPLRFELAAPSPELLADYIEGVGASLKKHSRPASDVSYTLSLRRPDLHTVSFSAENERELVAQLSAVGIAVRNGTLPSTKVTAIAAGRLVSLPPSPLFKRRFWAKTDPAQNKDLKGRLAEKSPELGAAYRMVMEAVCSVTARLPAEVHGSHRLVADLGFDSLSTLELIAALAKASPGLPAPSRALFKSSLTVDELAADLQRAIDSGPALAVKTLLPVTFRHTRHPWLHDHRPGGRLVFPLAGMMVAAIDALQIELNGPFCLAHFQVHTPLPVQAGDLLIHLSLREDLSFDLGSSAVVVPVAAGQAKRGATPLPLLVPDPMIAGTLSLARFYAEFSFHGPSIQSLVEVPWVGVSGAVGYLRAGDDAVLMLDGALQLALYWIAETRRQATVVVGFESFRPFAPWPTAGRVRCVASLAGETAHELLSDFDFFDQHASLIAQWRGVRSPKPDGSPSPGLVWPEIQELALRKAAITEAGFRIPYFIAHDGIAGATTQIEGRAMLNFSSYNYLGLAGMPAVTHAAIEALQRYGTSASASRIASGERPPHALLEQEITNFLGCEAALTLVSGHATNVTLIGHLFGPEDLIIHDSLAHDCIVSGARLSGAKRVVYPHNDLPALEKILKRERASARRTLIALEGVYSMDGDLGPLPEIVRLKQAYDAMVLIDEAHSVGVLGPTGRGAGEHFGVARGEIDFWMGTLSKAFASCGGYVAGTAEMIEYLRYTLPGFIYSVGLPPASAASAAAAVQILRDHPELTQRLQARSEFFRQRCKNEGIDTGMSEGSAVIPCITGSSQRALRLSAALEKRGINVQPIFHPAVEEGKARLRFFITADHTEEQLAMTAEIIGLELRALHNAHRGVTK